MVKKAPPHFAMETAGVIATRKVINDWKWIWRSKGEHDVGIDGEVEIVTASNEPQGKLLGVQIKAGRSYIHHETEVSFEFHPRKDDLDYWLEYSLKVVLVVLDPLSGSLYWVSIPDYVRDHPDVKTTLRIVFQTTMDSLDATAKEGWRSLAFGGTVSYAERKPSQISEVLHTNLLKARQLPAQVLAAEALDPPESGRLTIDRGIAIARDKRIWFFCDPSKVDDLPSCGIDQGTVSAFSMADVLADRKLRSYFIVLLYRAFNQHCRTLGLIFDKRHKRFFFTPDNGGIRELHYQSTHKKSRREVAAPFPKKGKPRFWWHLALKAVFEVFDNDIYLRLTPAYVFTRDGYEILTGEDVVRLNVKRRKKEFNRQVFQHLLVWREVLANHGDAIRIQTGAEDLQIDKRFLCQTVPFGIFGDSRNITSGGENFEVQWERALDDERAEDHSDSDSEDEDIDDSPEEDDDEDDDEDELDEVVEEGATASDLGDVEA